MRILIGSWLGFIGSSLREYFSLKHWESWSPVMATIIIVIILTIWG